MKDWFADYITFNDYGRKDKMHGTGWDCNAQHGQDRTGPGVYIVSNTVSDRFGIVR